MVQIDLFDLTWRLTRITQGRIPVLSLSGGYNKNSSKYYLLKLLLRGIHLGLLGYEEGWTQRWEVYIQQWNTEEMFLSATVGMDKQWYSVWQWQRRFSYNAWF